MKEITFTGKIRKVGDISTGITIPKNDVECLKLKEGEYVKVIIKRI